MAQLPKRETAKICRVSDLLSGEYVVQDGLLPNYVLSNDRKLSRVNIIGVVVNKPTPYDFMFDDGSGTILVTDFNQTKIVQKLSVGQPVLIIGRPRKTGEEIFLACEVAATKQLQQEPAWITLRQQELEHLLPEPKEAEPVVELEDIEDEDVEEIKQEPTPIESIALSPDEVIKFIKQKDEGDGCLIEEIISYFGNEADTIVISLISMGEIFEMKPGKVKVLE